MSSDNTPSPARILDRSVQLGRARVAFVMLAAIQVTLILGITVIAIALPAIADELALRSGQLALVSAGYGLAFAGLLLIGGRLTDLLGQRRVLVTGMVIFGLASAAAGLAPGFATLLASRLAQGVGAALAAPAAMALLSSVFPQPRRHTRVVAVWGGLAPLGATTGIALSGVAVTIGSWRWAFAVPVVVAAVAVAISRRLLPPGPAQAPTRLDAPGAVLATVGITLVSYGLVTAGDQDWTSPVAVLALLAGAAALAGFVAVEARTRAPLVPLSFVRSPQRAAGLGAVAIVAAGHSGIAFFLALYLQQVRGMSALATTAAFLPFLLLLPPAGLFAARLVARGRAHVVAAAGLALGAVGLVLIGRLGMDTPYVGSLLVGLLVFPVGAGLVFSGATVVAMEGTNRDRAGLAGALVNTAVEVGPTVGLAVLVLLAGTRTAQLLDTGHTAAAATSGGYGFALTVAAAGFALAAAGLAVAGHRPRGTAGAHPPEVPVREENP